MTHDERKAELNKMYADVVKNSKLNPPPELITPEIATMLLETSKFRNRPLDKSRLYQYSEQILAGNWKTDGHSIQISPKGNLLNGYTTMNAIKETGVAIPLNVVRNVPEETFDVMDNVRPRTTADCFYVVNIPYAKATSAAVGFYHRYRNYKRLLHNTNRRPSHSLSLQIVRDNPSIVSSVEFCNRKAMKKLAGPGLAAFCHFEFAQKSKPDADYFFQHLMDGDELHLGSPIRALREKLLSEKMSRASTPAHDIAVFFFKAWNAFRAKKPLPRGSFKRDLDFIPDAM